MSKVILNNWHRYQSTEFQHCVVQHGPPLANTFDMTPNQHLCQLYNCQFTTFTSVFNYTMKASGKLGFVKVKAQGRQLFRINRHYF